MYNRYQGNTGRVSREGEPEAAPHRQRSMPDGHMRGSSEPPARQRSEARVRSAAPQQRSGGEHTAHPVHTNGGGPPPETGGGPLSGLLGNLSGMLSGVLPKVLPDGLETGDLLMLLILYLMYKESGDKELLIIMGAMFLL